MVGKGKGEGVSRLLIARVVDGIVGIYKLILATIYHVLNITKPIHLGRRSVSCKRSPRSLLPHTHPRLFFLLSETLRGRCRSVVEQFQ